MKQVKGKQKLLMYFNKHISNNQLHHFVNTCPYLLCLCIYDEIGVRTTTPFSL